MSGAEEYARWVLAQENELENGRLIKLAAKRFLSDLQRTDIYFDEVEACKMVNFGERYCYQWEGEWRGVLVKFELWQRFIFEQIYGWYRKDNGRRRFNRFYLQISKKNGKSTMCAILALFHLFADKINTPKVFTAANNEDQAKICVNMAGRIVEQSPDLYEFVSDGDVKLSTYGKNITEVIHKEKDGFISAFSKETDDKKAKTAGGKHGVNASLGLVDEFGMSPDYGASGSIESSMASRLEWLMAFFTTSGFNLEGPCYTELRAMGIQVLEGVVEMDNYLPIIYEIDRPKDKNGKPKEITAQWLLENPQFWRQSNPNLNVSVNPDFLKSQLERAILRRGTVEIEVKTLNFNIWCESAEVFIPSEIWNRNAHGITAADLEGMECFGGIEIVSGKLMNAFCLLFPDVKGKTVLKLLFWGPDEYIKTSKDSDQLRDWARDGYINTVLGSVSDNDKVFDMIMDELHKYNMHSFAFKSNLENTDIVQALIRNGYEGNPISHGYQGISTPTLIWEEMFTAGGMEHFNNPVLTWMNSNCMAVRKDHDIRLEKSGSRVVGIYAGINALAQWKTISAGEIPVDTQFTEL